MLLVSLMEPSRAKTYDADDCDADGDKDKGVECETWALVVIRVG